MLYIKAKSNKFIVLITAIIISNFLLLEAARTQNSKKNCPVRQNTKKPRAVKANQKAYTYKPYKELETMRQYNDLMKQSKTKPVIINWYSDDCKYCKDMESAWCQAAEKHGRKAVFCKINADKKEFDELANKNEITSVPRTQFIVDSKVKRLERGGIANPKEFDKSVVTFFEDLESPEPAKPATK